MTTAQRVVRRAIFGGTTAGAAIVLHDWFGVPHPWVTGSIVVLVAGLLAYAIYPRRLL